MYVWLINRPAITTKLTIPRTLNFMRDVTYASGTARTSIKHSPNAVTMIELIKFAPRLPVFHALT